MDYKNQKYSAKERAEDLLSKMTIKEKVGQLNQRLYGFAIYERSGDTVTLTQEFKDEVEKYSGLGTLYGLYRADPWSGRNFTTGLSSVMAPKVYNMVQRYVIEHSRLGIPMLLSTECPHGHQALDGYLLPVNLCLGATFHPELLEEAYSVCGSQLKKMGVDMALVSNLDILRDPRWGRSEECFSEDPYLASEFARASVNGIQKEGVAVVAKHFCAQGEGTGGVNASAARIGERELREIHLPAAKACCEEQVQGVMAAYNEIDGVLCHANKRLLTDVLRDEMHFEGVVMSDGIAIDQLDIMTGDRVVSGAMALKAGVDIGLWDTAYTKLEEALERGLITMDDLDRSVLRVLTMKFERGLFDNPYIEETKEWSDYSYEKFPQSLNLSRESLVLLKNESKLLPLNPDKITSIAVIGPNADAIYNQLGDYTPPIREAQGVTILQGVKKLVQELNEQNSVDIMVKYCPGCGLFDGLEEEIEKAVKTAASCDITILALGGSSSRFSGAVFDSNGAAITDEKVRMDCGEGVDCCNLELPEIQQRLAEKVLSATSHVITVMIQGRPYVITEIAEKTEALLCSFYPGIKGGQAIAELLFGKISPSGRLPVSIPRHTGQLPVYYNYKASYQAMNYYDVEKTPLYSFGSGLSYTEFQYDNITLSKEKISLMELRKEGIKLSLKIQNTGEYDSFAVPQLYVRDKQASVIRRVRELKAFTKVWVPKEDAVLASLSLNEEKLSIWNDQMKFVMEPGDFELYLCDCGKVIWKGQITVVSELNL